MSSCMRRQRQNRKRLILGLTGTFGSGKSTVARMLKSDRNKIIDADKIAHRVLGQADVYKKITGIFGREVIENDSIDRSRLGGSVFCSKRLLGKLQEIVHPKIIRIIKEEIKDYPDKDIILDAPLLIEVGLERLADKVLVVKISREEQVRRLIRKTNLCRKDILRRINAQIPLSTKVRMADFVIDNSGTLKETKEQVGKIRRLLWKS
jgi:dephospho-CoA kinase